MQLLNKNTAVLHYFTNGKYSIKSAEVLTMARKPFFLSIRTNWQVL